MFSDDWHPAKAPVAPKSWIDPRNDRPSEFAPPSFYYPAAKETPDEDYAPVQKQAKQDSEPAASSPISDKERIERVLAEVKGGVCDEKPQSATTVKTKDPTDDEITPSPYVQTDKPITMKLISKPTKILNRSFIPDL